MTISKEARRRAFYEAMSVALEQEKINHNEATLIINAALTAYESALQAKLTIATKALEWYADSNNLYGDCYESYRENDDGKTVSVTAMGSRALEALKQIKG